VGQQRFELASLDASNFDVVGSEAKDGSSGSLAQVADVGGVAIQYCPSDAGANRSLGHLRQCSAAHRLEDDGAGAGSRSCLNSLENLGALIDGVVIGENNLNFHAEFAAGGIGRLRLFDLVVVIAGRKRDQEFWFRHNFWVLFK
jgi:hypothetical protein